MKDFQTIKLKNDNKVAHFIEQNQLY